MADEKFGVIDNRVYMELGSAQILVTIDWDNHSAKIQSPMLNIDEEIVCENFDNVLDIRTPDIAVRMKMQT